MTMRFNVGFYSQDYQIITGITMANESHKFKGLCYPLGTNWFVAHEVCPISYYSKLMKHHLEFAADEIFFLMKK